MKQKSLFSESVAAQPWQKPEVQHDGETYDHEQDKARLSGMLGRVFEAMSDGEWWSLERLKRQCGGSEASISARIRDLRKEKFGGYQVERQRFRDGLWTYRLLLSDSGCITEA